MSVNYPIRVICVVIVLVIGAACQPQTSAPRLPSPIPFPTMTVGQTITGALPRDGIVQTSGGISPATAVALINQPTATPDYSQCPPEVENVTLRDDAPTLPEGVTDTILRFLNAGGRFEDLEDALIAGWDFIGDNGYIRRDMDLTGELEPEILLGYTAPGDIGTLLIIGCENGRYVRRYQAFADGIDPPQLVWLADVNNDARAEVILANRQCIEAADACEYEILMLSWNTRAGRFGNLLENTLLTLDIPRISDMDDDDVAELVVELRNQGTSATGPLRTGVNIYDWDGEVYTLSIIQLDSPRYRIQYVHEGDKALLNLDAQTAAQLYVQALDGDGLRYWFNDGPTTVTSYALYRLLLAAAYDDNIALDDVRQRLAEAYPNISVESADENALDDLPVFAEFAFRFLRQIDAGATLTTACNEIRTLVDEQQDERNNALELLNRYGNRSPQYTALEICPF